MRPLKLMMQAFGPYAETEIIDFSKLENHTMFVISGKTGSGKTTIFDGISFAIYGRASGDDRVGADLRSQFAQDDLTTEVSLEFSLKGNTYYILRSPQQEKKKSRGEGYTVINAKAELYIIDPAGERKLLAANVRDTDEKIKEIIQLDANQFRQILMIPQGEFRKLLTSDSKEKEAILQKLFHTELYKQIEEKLKELASNLKREVEQGITERSRLLKNIVYKQNEQLDEALQADQLNDTNILLLLEDQIIKMEKEKDLMKNKMEQQKLHRDEAKRLVDAAEDLLKQMKVRDELLEKKRALLNKEEDIVLAKKEIDMAHKANKIQHQEELCQRLKIDLEHFEVRIKSESSQLEQFEIQLNKAYEQLHLEEQKASKRDQLFSELSMLKNMREGVISYASRKANVIKSEKDLIQCQNQMTITKRKLEEKSKELQEQENKLKELEKLQIKAFELDREVVKLESGLRYLQTLNAFIEKHTSLEDKISIKKSELEHAKKVVDDAKESLKIIENQWNAGQAGHLATSLISGQPCPVCGSLKHPNPAIDKNFQVDDKDIKSAQENVDSAFSYHSHIEREWLIMSAESDVLRNQIDDTLNKTLDAIPHFSIEEKDVFLVDYELQLSKTSEVLSNHRLQIKRIPAIEKIVSQHREVIEEVRLTLEHLQEKERHLSIMHSESVLILENLSLTIPEELRDIEKYNKKVSYIENEIKKMDYALKTARESVTKNNEQVALVKGTINTLQDNIKSVSETLKIERNIFLEKLEEEKFTSFKHYSESKKNVNEINQLDNMVRQFYEELRSIADRLSDYESRLENKDQPDLESLQDAFIESEKILQLFGEQYSHLNIQIEKNNEIKRSVTLINQQIKDLESEYELVGHLADITRGQNTYKLSFERFVLASFLDGILESANVRLIKMTNGRYQLIRKKNRSKGNIQSGLELLVFDQYTGQERHVKTLSGGESFKSALALALGLADIVQEYAGGVSLETMFIDEGFGTLDPESLDQAIEALMDIQSSGRLVGIISHVPELKERIDARLEVFADHNGSKTEFQFIG
ncbi:AAA family ATPase [Lederbergia wuyishanensis]|uniref:Nuclease SbcCD subunit C n=1 Tax=Lederbergia wuyishanensis TaxID=1347903 RepID=A0ABU0D012_9BACI|nr:AAA family ATPase [Lederbergia wuyishanensis]MCJ8006378.1 AAA family ATPase [Lederbergia wuyishanensis]MDQ0341747.1 exonuclease SbcC [Lederbergia wuyishanensis]